MKHRTINEAFWFVVFVFSVSCILLMIGAMTHAEIAIVNDGAARWECVEVLDGDDIVISTHTTQAGATECLLNRQRAHPDRVFRAASRERLRAVITEAEPPTEPEPPPPVEEPPTEEPPVEPSDNTPPEWIRVTRPNFTAGVVGTYYLAVDSRDADGDALTYSVEPDLPAGIILQGDKFTHDGSTAPGTYEVVIEASDGAATARTDTVTITVSEAVSESPPDPFTPPPVETLGALHWRAPTEWTDGRAIDEISGFRIYDGDVLRLVVSGDIRAIDMLPGCYRMTAVSEGIQSPLSNTGCVE